MNQNINNSDMAKRTTKFAGSYLNDAPSTPKHNTSARQSELTTTSVFKFANVEIRNVHVVGLDTSMSARSNKANKIQRNNAIIEGQINRASINCMTRQQRTQFFKNK